MIELRAFGGLDLRTEDGKPLDDLLRQPKRAALLAYLALAEPAGFHRRDTILLLFWPDLNAARARAALRKSLHVLRAALGPDLIVSRGDDEVGIDWQHLRCDVSDFSSALAKGKVAEALALYRGDLLTGFHLNDSSPEWEQWLDARRTGLKSRAAEAAWKYATALAEAGDTAEGVKWARWASARVPDDEHAVQRLLRLLGELGDRAGAMQLYEQFSKRLEAEYGGTPAPETQKLIAAIRARVTGPEIAPLAPVVPPPALPTRTVPAAQIIAAPTTGAPAIHPPSPGKGSRWRRVAVIGVVLTIAAAVGLSQHTAATLDPDRLAIAPFQMFDTSLTSLGVGVEEFVSRTLDQTGKLRMVPPSVALRASSGAVDVASAARFGRTTGAGLVLIGSLMRQGGDSVRIDASLIETRSGHRLGDVTIPGTIARVDLLVDDLSGAILRTLGSVGRVIPLPHSRITARSLPAVKAFLAGEMAMRRGAWDTAQTAFREAVGLDTTFSLAWLKLGTATLFIDMPGNPEHNQSGWQYVIRAGSTRGGLSRHDSTMVAIATELAAFSRNMVPPDSAPHRAAQLLTAATVMTRDYPDDAEAWFVLGSVRAAFLPIVPATWSEAGSAFIKATELDSTFVPAYRQGMMSVFDLGDTVAGVRLARRFLKLPLSAAARALPLLVDRLFTPSVGIAERERLLDSAPPEALYLAWDRLWLLADPTERAVAVARAATRRTPDPRYSYTAPDIVRRDLAATLAYRGHVREAYALAGTEYHFWFSNLLPDLAMAGVVPATVADSAIHAWVGAGPSSRRGAMFSLFWLTARRDTTALGTLMRSDPRPPLLLVAAHALARGDTAGAIQHLQAWRPREVEDIYGTIVLARLLEAKGQRAAALAVLRRPPNNDWPSIARVFWRLDRARLEEQLGDKSGAADDYAFVLAVWRNADPELTSYLTEARDGLKRLGGGKPLRDAAAGGANRLPGGANRP